MKITVSEIAQQLEGEVIGDGTIVLTGFASAENAQAGDLTFAEKESYFATAEQSAAAAILVTPDFSSATKTLIHVASPRVAMARLLPLFFPEPALPSGIHPTAVIAASATVDATAHIGPHVVIGENVRIGARCALLGGNHVGADSRIGEDSRLHPNVVLYPRSVLGDRVVIHANTTVGSDGFGYTFDEGHHRKVLQVGFVKIGNDVEIGANGAIDRGTLGPTVIGDGCKIDNFIHLAHNVILGRHCVIMGQVGIAGSTQVGDYGVIASQTGIAGHLKIGPQVTIAAKSGIMRDVPAQSTILGVPAVPIKQAKRQWICIQQLPELNQRVKALEKKAAEKEAGPAA